MAKLTRRSVLLAKAETTIGTDASPAAANAIEAYDVNLTPINGNRQDMERATAYFGANESILTDNHVSLEFKVKLAGSGTAGAEPPYAPLLQACGMKLTKFNASGETNKRIELDPLTDNPITLTFYMNKDGNLHKITSARGTFTCDITQGDVPSLQFNFIGVDAGISTQALPNVSYASFKNPVAASKAHTDTVSILGQNIICNGLNVDFGSETQSIDWANAHEIAIVGRNVTGTIQIQDPGVDVYNYFTAAINSTSGALIYKHGKTAGNIIEITAPKLSIDNVAYADKSGQQALDCSFRLLPDAGNDDIKITIK